MCDHRAAKHKCGNKTCHACIYCCNCGESSSIMEIVLSDGGYSFCTILKTYKFVSAKTICKIIEIAFNMENYDLLYHIYTCDCAYQYKQYMSSIKQYLCKCLIKQNNMRMVNKLINTPLWNCDEQTFIDIIDANNVELLKLLIHAKCPIPTNLYELMINVIMNGNRLILLELLQLYYKSTLSEALKNPSHRDTLLTNIDTFIRTAIISNRLDIIEMFYNYDSKSDIRNIFTIHKNEYLFSAVENNHTYIIEWLSVIFVIHPIHYIKGTIKGEHIVEFRALLEKQEIQNCITNNYDLLKYVISLKFSEMNVAFELYNILIEYKCLYETMEADAYKNDNLIFLLHLYNGDIPWNREFAKYANHFKSNKGYNHTYISYKDDINDAFNNLITNK